MQRGILFSRRNQQFDKYYKSHIFSPPPKNNTDKKTNYTVTPKINENKTPKINFTPRYEAITAKKRYKLQFTSSMQKRKKSQKEDDPMQNDIPKQTLPTIEEKSKIANAQDIMCRDMYNGMDTKEYKLNRSRSTFLRRSVPINCDNLSARKRGIDFNMSNIFFINDNNATYKKFINNNNNLAENANKDHTLNKKTTNEDVKRPPIKHSLYQSNADWKYINTETNAHIRSNTFINKLLKKCFHRSDRLMKDNYSNIQEQKKLLNDSNRNAYLNNVESVKYNIISNKDANKTIDTYITPIEDNQITENYEVVVNKNFDITDINTIKNYFVIKGIHVFHVNEHSDLLGYKKGKIQFQVRRDKNEENFNTKIQMIGNYLSEKNMKLNKLQENPNKEHKKKLRRDTLGKALLKNSTTTNVLNRPQM